ncbi:MAG TPA: ImmA/IrrE family metallo-endopeptidase [Sphingomicrobium sp.]
MPRELADATGVALMTGWRFKLPTMFGMKPQPSLPIAPEPPSEPAVADQLSELFYSALATQTPDDLIEFVEFCARFRRHAVFNVRLIQVQRRGARAVASVDEWRAAGRYILPDARPIIILMPFRPIVYVYDIEDTGPPVDRAAIGDPFAATGPAPAATIAATIDRLADACMASNQFRIRIERDRLGYSFAGSAAHQGHLALPEPESRPGEEHGRVVSEQLDAVAQNGKKAGGRLRWLPHWRVKLNDRMTPAEQLVTVSHELGHIFCGHTGRCDTLKDTSGWPDGSSLPHNVQEMEAEAVAWLIANRAGLKSASAAYLKRHVEGGDTALVDVSLVERAASRIEAMAGLRYGKGADASR